MALAWSGCGGSEAATARTGAAGAIGTGGLTAAGTAGGVDAAAGAGGAAGQAGGAAGQATGGNPVPTGGSSAAGAPGGAAGATSACAAPWAGDFQLATAQDDELTSVRAAAGGGFLITGYEGGDDHSSDVIPSGDARAIVARYDAGGRLLWETAIDTPQADTAEDVRIDASGNLVVVGRTAGAFTGFQNAGQMDLFVAVLDASGNLLSSTQLGDERPQHPARLALGGGKILVVGSDDIFIPSNYVAALPHGFLAEFTAGAAPQMTLTESFWQRSALFGSPPPPPSNQDFWTGVAVDGDGAIYVTSTVDGAVALRGMFITKMDGAGQTVWTNRFSSNAGDYVSAVGLNQNGDLIVTGAASLELAGTELGQQDVFVAKIDKTAGAVQWVTAAGSTESDFPTDMTFDAQGNIYVTGQTVGTFAGANANHGGVDLFVVKVGPSGGVLGSWQTGSTGDDLPTGVAVDACGSVYVGGFTTASLVPGQPNAGGNDAFVVKAGL